MSGVLYIVATPIGNLDDISLRAIATLKAVQFVAAEDTRHSRTLMRHLGIDQRMISCHEHNEESRCDTILQTLAQGGDVALISDAGTPLISDPGYRLVNAAREAGFRVSPIPGASSVIAALCASGLATEKFHFYGFLSSRSTRRASQLQALQDIDGTLLLFESGRRIMGLLQQLQQFFPRRQCVVAKELTKLHEQFLCGEAAQLLAQFEQDDRLTRGEFVVLIDNANPPAAAHPAGEAAAILRILLEEVPLKAAARIAARLTGSKKNDLYQLALRLRASQDADETE